MFFKEVTMPGVKVQRKKTQANRAVIYARVSDESQDAEDKTSISEQVADHRRTIPGGGQGLVQEATGVPDGSWTSTLRSSSME